MSGPVLQSNKGQKFPEYLREYLHGITQHHPSCHLMGIGPDGTEKDGGDIEGPQALSSNKNPQSKDKTIHNPRGEASTRPQELCILYHSPSVR